MPRVPAIRAPDRRTPSVPTSWDSKGRIAWTLGGRVHPYLGAGYNHLAPRFQVNFTNRFGDVDRTRVAVDLDRAVLFAGAAWSVDRLRVSGEIYRRTGTPSPGGSW